MSLEFIRNLLDRLLGKSEPEHNEISEVIDIGQGELLTGGERPQGLGGGPHDLFEHLTMTENLDGMQSETIEGGLISELNTPDFPQKSIRRELTDDGYRTTTEEAFLLTQAGNIIHSEALVGGGRCSECGAISDKENTFMCAHCHKSLCRLCFRFLPDQVLCPEHYDLVLWNLDTWRGRGGESEK